jgi:hypothetical protein
MARAMKLRVGEAGLLRPGVNVQFCGEFRRAGGLWRSYSVMYVNRSGGFEGGGFADVCVRPAGGRRLSDRQAREQAKAIVAARRGRGRRR